MASSNQPLQPPKQASYLQSDNPVSQKPSEQQAPKDTQRQHGDAVPSISRTAESLPSNDASLARLQEQHDRHRRQMQSAPDVDTEYGVEQQPAEGKIAAAVEGKSARSRARMQAGAHAGPVGSARGPGAPAAVEALREDKGTMTSDMGRKTKEHEEVLGERVGQSPPTPADDDDSSAAEREGVRRQKLKQHRELDVSRAVGEASGGVVVGSKE